MFAITRGGGVVQRHRFDPHPMEPDILHSMDILHVWRIILHIMEIILHIMAYHLTCMEIILHAWLSYYMHGLSS